MTRRGRRPGDPGTRDRILDTARTAFAEHGYERATIRLIAAGAGVDPALVHHYFGTKEDLFAEAVRLPLRPAEAVEEVFADGLDGVARRLTSLFFRAWESRETREALLGQLRMAMTSGRPPPMRDFVVAAMLGRVAARLPGPDPALRIELVAAQLLGVAVLRHVLELEPIASTPVERLAELVLPRVAAYLTPGPVEDAPI